MNRPALLRLDGTVRVVNRLAQHVEHPAERLWTYRHRDWSAGVDGLHPARHAVGRLHRDGPHPVLAQMLLDFCDHVDLLDAGAALGHDAVGVVDLRQPLAELDVDDRADDLNDLARPLCSCCMCPFFPPACLKACPTLRRTPLWGRLPRCCPRYYLDDFPRDRRLSLLVHV